MPIDAHLFRQTILTRKVGQTGLLLVCDEDSLVDLCIQDHKSLCVAVTTQTDTQTDRHTHTETAFDLLISRLAKLVTKTKIVLLEGGRLANECI